MRQPNYLQTLNERQLEAVLHEAGTLLILAGAGSGKTRVITSKIAYLIDSQQVSPYNILAVTFTNKAAGEMRERAKQLTPDASNVQIRTFHSFGAWLLRLYAERCGMAKEFAIYDSEDSVSLLRSLFPDWRRRELRSIATLISRAKDLALGPDDDLSPLFSPQQSGEERRFRMMYTSYQARMQEIGNADFGDLIVRPVRLLRDDPEIRDTLRDRFRAILVDEYQDSNVAQFELLKLLSWKENYLCVVGDDDQSIYRFRGAEVRNILTFPDHFPSTTIIKLEQNYRSTGSILEVASSIIAHNRGRLGKVLWTDHDRGQLPTLAMLQNDQQEADYCVNLTKDTKHEMQSAILYRINAQSRLFESALIHAGIGYRILGSIRFYEREEIKDSLALLRFALNPRDEISFRRIVNKPTRGIGEVSIGKLLGLVTENDANILELCGKVEPLLSGGAVGAIRRFRQMIEEAQADLQQEGDEQLGSFVEALTRRSGLWEWHRRQDEIAGVQKVQNLEELVNAASLYPKSRVGLVEFLESVELDSGAKQDTNDATVTLVTVHNTKGLEFDRVIVTGLEEGLFPFSFDGDEQEIEEERRLFYVATTRARRLLHLTTCRSRTIHGQTTYRTPSIFLGELPKHSIAIDSMADHGARFPVGCSVHHDSYGVGEVVKNWNDGKNRIVFVQFQSGRSTRFIERYASLEKIEDG